MKKIIITITPNGLLVFSSWIALISLNSAEPVTEKLFLKTINEKTSICLN